MNVDAMTVGVDQWQLIEPFDIVLRDKRGIAAQKIEDRLVVRPLVDVIAKRNDGPDPAARMRSDAGQPITEQVGPAVNVRDDVGDRHQPTVLCFDAWDARMLSIKTCVKAFVPSVPP